MFGLGYKIAAGTGIALALSLAWGMRVDHLRAHWKGIAGEYLTAVQTVTGNKKLDHKTAPTFLYKWRTDQQTAYTNQLVLTIRTERSQTRNAMEKADAYRVDRDKLLTAVDRLRAKAKANPGARIPTGVSGSATIRSDPAGETVSVSVSDGIEIDDALHRYTRLIEQIEANRPD